MKITNLPATTEPEIAALPDGPIYQDARGLEYTKSRGNWYWISRGRGRCEPVLILVRPGLIVRKFGGITARLVDPAPLEALLREAASGICVDPESMADGQVSVGSAWACGECYECRIEATLSGPEEEETNDD